MTYVCHLLSLRDHYLYDDNMNEIAYIFRFTMYAHSSFMKSILRSFAATLSSSLITGLEAVASLGL